VTFAFIAKHRGVWPAGWLCEALGVSCAGFSAWRTRPPSVRAWAAEQLLIRVRASFLTSDRTDGARRVWHDLLVEGIACGLHRIERLMRHAALRARPRRRRMPLDTGGGRDARRRTKCAQPDVRRLLGEPHMGGRLHVSLDRRRLALCRRGRRSLLATGGRVVHACNDDRAACYRCAGDGDLAAGHAPHRTASLRSREPVYE
jgi:transposase InsO family protein